MVVDLLLEHGLQGLSNEFSTMAKGEGFCVVEDVSVGSVLGGGDEVIKISGGAFEKQFASGLVRTIWAGRHSNQGVRIG